MKLRPSSKLISTKGKKIENVSKEFFRLFPIKYSVFQCQLACELDLKRT